LRSHDAEPDDCEESPERPGMTFHVHTVHGSTYTVAAACIRVDGLMTVFWHAENREHPLLILTTAHILSISPIET
jgi:hypothetical protein